MTKVWEFLTRHPELAANIHMPAEKGVNGRRLLSIPCDGRYGTDDMLRVGEILRRAVERAP